MEIVECEDGNKFIMFHFNNSDGANKASDIITSYFKDRNIFLYKSYDNYTLGSKFALIKEKTYYMLKYLNYDSNGYRGCKVEYKFEVDKNELLKALETITHS